MGYIRSTTGGHKVIATFQIADNMSTCNYVPQPDAMAVAVFH